MRPAGIVFLGNTRPEIDTDASGRYRLTLVLLDAISPRRRERWRVSWVGDEARQWWEAFHPRLVPGQPIDAVLERPRAHATNSRPPLTEIHADVVSLALAPSSSEAVSRVVRQAEQQHPAPSPTAAAT